MSLSLELAPEVEEALRSEARRRGVKPEELASHWIAELASPTAVKSLEHEEWVRRTRAWSESHRHWPTLPDTAMERESFYEDRW